MGSLESNVPEADVLVIGIGPAGGAFAAFAAQYGSYYHDSRSRLICSLIPRNEEPKLIAIAKAPGTADTPRAHILNPF